MKTNWKLINQARDRAGYYASTDEAGFNGAFHFKINNLPINVIASDGMGWQHVSVSIHDSHMTPSWSVMCQIKEIFWGDDEWVMQLHPPASENISNHPGCLHLWRPTGEVIPTPPPRTVGVKKAGKLQSKEQAAALRFAVDAGLI